MITHKLDSLLSPSNSVFAEARSGRRIPNGLIATLIQLAMAFGGMLLAFLATVLIVGDEKKADALMNGSYGLVVPFALIVLLLGIWIRLYEKRPFKSLGLVWSSGAALRSYFAGFFFGAVMVGAIVGSLALFQKVTIQSHNLKIDGSSALGGVLIALLCFVVQGGSEEILFRGWYMPVLGARYRPWIGVLASSILFSALHFAPSPVAIINLVLFGLFLALHRLRDETIWWICGWHSAWNWTMGNGLGFTVSGQATAGTILVDLEAEGHPLLTGGDYGLEGSLIATAVLLLGIAIVVITFRDLGNDSER
ncbi:MAG: CPBP family intramembrane metalloprotease [Candidatus Aminicenantes bacterium]|nr:CPBP family intramembrane metalloprotease [Candidatus Aminicenantes bacterium]